MAKHQVPESADVVVVGGGIIGLSVALALKRRSTLSVVVLERAPVVGSGSSPRANGGVRAQFTTPINIDFSLFSIDALEKLHADSGGVVAFHQAGYLLMAGTSEGAEGLAAAAEVQRSRGVATESLGPHEIARLAPLVRTEGVLAANFHARDGFLDPHGYLATVHEAAKRAGATICTNAGVVGIEPGSSGLVTVTTKGRIASTWVVDAAGAHAGEVAGLVGVDLPVYPVRRNMAFVRPQDDDRTLIPMCVDLDTGVLVRKEAGGGFLIGYSNPADKPGWDESFDPVFMEEVAERIGHRFPSLEDLAIDPRHAWAGLYPETPDHHAVVGAAKGAEGFIVCGGFGGHGLMHAPAAGAAVAELIVEGRCVTFDLHPLRPERFEEGDLIVEAAVL